MSVTDAASKGTLRLRSAADFFAALRSPDIGTRVGVLRAIAQSPEKALAFGRFQGGDVIDVLVQQAYQKQGYSNWKLVVSVLAAFRDPRVVEHFKKILMTWRKPEAIRIALARLSLEPMESIEPTLRPLLRQTECLAQTRAAADLLLRAPSLDAAEAIRVSVANTQGVSVAPALDESNAALWIAELHGRFADGARRLLETQGESAFQVLKRRWPSLDVSVQEWLLAWGVTRWPLATVEPLVQALQSEREELLLAALRCVERLGVSAPLFRDATSQLAGHHNPAVRVGAVRAGATGIDWRRALRQETDLSFVQASAARLAAEEGARCVPDLIELLKHADWQVRATATRLLVELGEPAVAQVEPLIASAKVETRVAAAQILVELGRQEWLEEHLLS
jgi:hypothetical protein